VEGRAPPVQNAPMNQPGIPAAADITASQWRQIVNSATDTGIISTDPEGRITSWNTGAVRLFGWSEAETIGQSLERIFP
jgi:PAS domain S-box-containing protein